MSNNVNPPAEDFKYLQFLATFKALKVSKIGMALFGVGRAGMIHLGNMIQNPRVDLLYVVEADDVRNEQVKIATGLDHTKFVNSTEIETVLNDPKVQAVLVTTPTQTHQDLVMKALNKGKAVFCEKPIANQIKDVKACYELAEKLGLPLFCAFNRRFDPSFLDVKTRVGAGELGKIHVVKTCSRDSPLPSIEYLSTSNGIFHDCAVHDIDLICWILGEFPNRVYSAATTHMKPIADIDDHDTVSIQMTFPSGAIGCIDLSRFACYGYDQRLEVFGPGGMLQCGNQNAVGVQAFKAAGVGEAPIWYSFASRYEEAYKRELDAFVDVLQGKGDVMLTATDTLSVCRIASACEESARSGKPIDITYQF